MSRKLVQIDLVKSIAILAVIVMHLSQDEWLESVGYLFHLEQAVPVFVVVMGLTSGLSFSRCELFSLRDYFSRRFVRLVAPYVTLTVVTAALQVLRSVLLGIHPWKVDIGWYTLVGIPPIEGPGTYFIGIAIQWSIIAPFVWLLYRRAPITTVVILNVIGAAFMFAAPHVDALASSQYLYSANVIRYLGPIAIGLWLSDGWHLRQRRNWWLVPAAGAALVYNIARTRSGANPIFPFLPSWEVHNFVSLLYAPMLVVLGMKFAPSVATGHVVRALTVVGRASYHIFLVQMVYFGVHLQSITHEAMLGVSGGPFAFVLAAVLTSLSCVILGVSWWKIEHGLLIRRLTTVEVALAQ
ncbi:MAG: acyltransferase [Deltaproteobacteria bacterium]|nr:acyltransferase [Deltaproteobacteria bacterium]